MPRRRSNPARQKREPELARASSKSRTQGRVLRHTLGMRSRSIPAVFMRGGTSRGLVVKADDLPADRTEWDAIFCAAMGSPDPHGRQLNGMGGGLSSLSKVCVVARPSRADADIDYSFSQVALRAGPARSEV